MYYNYMDTYQTQQYDVVNDGILQGFINHGIAAVFDYDGFAIIFLNVRQGFNQHLRTV